MCPITHRARLDFLPSVTAAWSIALLIAAYSSMTPAAQWAVQKGVRAQETYTDNVRLQPKSEATSDLITEIAPYIRLNGQGDRLKLNFNYSPHLAVYAKNHELGTVNHALDANSQAEVIKNFFFLDADALVAQNVVSPFGPRQSDLPASNDNLVETYAVRVSPRLQGNFGPNLTWQARNETIWSWSSGNSVQDSQQARWSASVETPVQLVGARTEFQHEELDSTGQPTRKSDVARTYLYFQPRTSIRLSAIGGYERNNYSTLQETTNRIYGAGLDWRPSARTGVSATWENRYFGDSYQIALKHRSPRTASNLAFSRSASTYPQQLLQLPPGNTAVLLNTLLLSRIPDPTERAVAVDDIMRRAGLPPFLAAPQAIYSQQATLTENAVASFAILGVRNSLTFTVFRTAQERLSEQFPSGSSDTFATEGRVITRGISAALAHSVTAFTTITANYSLSRTQGSQSNFKGTQNDYRLRATHRLGPKTNIFSAVRYVRFDSEGSGFGDYQERALLAGIDHVF